MKAILLPLLFIAAGAAATPMTDFNEALRKPVETKLPPIWITFDENSDEYRELKSDGEYIRFLKDRAKGAERHQHLLIQITGDDRIRVNEFGTRTDRTNIRSIELSPRDWLNSASDTRNPKRLEYQKWAQDKGCLAAHKAKSAFAQLIDSTRNHLSQGHNARLEAFARQLQPAYEALIRLLDQQPTDEDLRILQQFLRQYAP